ncbi:MAG: aldehyde dehydrogenase family protein, partial [Nannocystaceae bacterium]
VPARAGAWYPPTLLKGVRPGMAAFDEEVFGPVVSVTRAEGWSEALSLANATGYGLGACLLGGDEAERAAFVEEARAGACFLGDFVRSDPRLPFGGIRESGYGRELGRAGILEFVNHKTVCVRRR